MFLAAGAAIGLVVAAAGLFRTGSATLGPLPADAVARVNGELIPRETYVAALDALAQDRRSGVDDAQRRELIDRLIDEELLLQRALELGLPRDDRRIRNQLIGAMISSIVAGQKDEQPSDEELRTFFERERDFFAAPVQVKLRQVWCRGGADGNVDDALQRARQAGERLRAGEDFAVVKAQLGDKDIAPLPGDYLPATKLGSYLGPTAVRTVLELPPGAISDPVRSQGGYSVFQLLDRQTGEPAPFEVIKPQVLAEFRRRSAETALRRYLDDLKQRSDIAIAPQPQ